MKHLLTTLLTTLTITTALAQNYRWAHGFGGPNSNTEGTSIATDAQANVYVIGSFGDNIDFDPGPGVAILNMQSFSPGIFVAKYDSAGIYQWAFSLNGYNGYASHLAVNATGLYITGCFNGTTDFDPSPAVANLTASSADIFLAKYDFSGSYQWAINIGADNVCIAEDIAIDDNGNSYITGFIRDTVDFDPGAGIAMPIPNTLEDIYFAKYDSNGNYVWAKTLGNPATFFMVECMTVDPTGLIISGKFSDTLDVDPSAGVYNLDATTGKEVYISKYDLNGNFIWAGNIGGSSGETIYSIASDLSGNGNFYITGGGSDTVDFDLTTGNYNVNCGTGRFCFAKYNLLGNLLFVKIAGSGGGNGRSMVVDTNENIYIIGLFAGIVDFDPGIDTANLVVTGSGFSADIFFAKYDNNGNYVWAKSMGGIYSDWGKAIAIDGIGNQYVTGFFTNSMDADPDGGIVTLSPAIAENIFIAKYYESPNAVINHTLTSADISIYPNPSDNYIVVNFHSSVKNTQFSVIDVNGREIITGKLNSSLKINVARLPPGVYLLKAKSQASITCKKFIKK
ncbi:MAG TPA: T9SS type A sorting domain-containing protein [Bacteroidia bacterium]|nr:T9SS type A sorting domain-containing protein [Bacteroidia bacterium]